MQPGLGSELSTRQEDQEEVKSVQHYYFLFKWNCTLGGILMVAIRPRRWDGLNRMIRKNHLTLVFVLLSDLIFLWQSSNCKHSQTGSFVRSFVCSVTQITNIPYAINYHNFVCFIFHQDIHLISFMPTRLIGISPPLSLSRSKATNHTDHCACLRSGGIIQCTAWIQEDII